MLQRDQLASKALHHWPYIISYGVPRNRVYVNKCGHADLKYCSATAAAVAPLELSCAMALLAPQP